MDNDLLVKSIRDLCKKNNIAISQLENELQFGAGLISRWNKNTPSLDKIIDIAKYFHASLDEVVGFNINQSDRDDFLNLLLENTQNGNIIWHSLGKSDIDDIQTYGLVGYDNYSEYSPDENDDYTFYMKYQEGYIVLYSVCHIDNVINPLKLYLAIQPRMDSTTCKLVNQKYDKEELLPLYLKVLTSLRDEAPDEIKAEALKASFINEFRKINNCTATATTNAKSILAAHELGHIVTQEGT